MPMAFWLTGAPPLAAYRAASISAARAFGLADRGLVAPGWRADLVEEGEGWRYRVAPAGESSGGLSHE